jgi:uncharacterized protein YciI
MTLRLFAVFATDRPGRAAVRAATRESHRAYLRQVHPEATLVALGGPTLDDAGEMNGTLLVVQARSIDAVRQFVAADPYSLNDLFVSVDVREWRCGLARLDALAPATATAAAPDPDPR